jgi:hypothetical protein
MKNDAPQTKLFFSKHHHPNAVEKRVSSNLKTSNLKIEFFKDQCSLEEYGAVFPLVNFAKNIPSTEVSN